MTAGGGGLSGVSRLMGNRLGHNPANPSIHKTNKHPDPVLGYPGTPPLSTPHAGNITAAPSHPRLLYPSLISPCNVISIRIPALACDFTKSYISHSEGWGLTGLKARTCALPSAQAGQQNFSSRCRESLMRWSGVGGWGVAGRRGPLLNILFPSRCLYPAVQPPILQNPARTQTAFKGATAGPHLGI